MLSEPSPSYLLQSVHYPRFVKHLALGNATENLTVGSDTPHKCHHPEFLQSALCLTGAVLHYRVRTWKTVTKLTPGSKRLDFLLRTEKKAAQQPSLTLWGLEAWVTAYRFAPRCRVQTVCSDPSSRSHKEIGIWVCSFKYHMGWYLHTLASNVVLKLRYPLHTLVYTADYNKITPSLHLLTEEKGGLGMHIWNSLCLILLIWSLQNDLAVLTPAQLSELQTVSKPGILCHSTTTAQTAVLSNRSM